MFESNLILSLALIIFNTCPSNGQTINTTHQMRWTLATPTAPPHVPAFSNCSQYSTSKELWVTYHGSKSCYFYGTGETTNYHSADENCRRKGSSLVSIHDFTTNYILSRPNGNYNGIYWIGMNSLNGTRGIYKWSDGTPHEWDNFANSTSYGDPLDNNVLYQGRCVAIQVVAQSNKGLFINIGKWFKDDCNFNRRLICQRPISPNTPPVPPPKPIPGGCPLKDWYKYGDEKCVKYMDTPLTFANARIACSKSKAELLSVHSLNEEDFITAITTGLTPPYIGLQYRDAYIGWTWEDQSNMTYTNFGVQDKDGHCGVLSTSAQPGKWLKVDCNEKHPFVCQTPQDPKRTTGRTLASNQCTIAGYDNFIQYRNSCYHVIDDPSTHLDFPSAEKSCQSLKGAHLVSVVDSVEQSFLRYYLSRNQNSSQFWIGLHSEIETKDNDSQVFEWTDGWPIYYMNWAPLEPQNPRVPEDRCTYYDGHSGTWRTVNCDQSLPYICKVSSDSVPQVQNNTNGFCPKLNGINDSSLAWVNLHKGTPYCYWFSTERTLSSGLQSWSDASYQCRRRNGTLVSIHSEHEMMILMARLKKSANDFISWIGLYKNPSGKYVWEDGSPLDFLNGLTVPTDDSVNGTNLNDDSGIVCAELRWDSTWNWGPCAGNKRNYFVCQTPKSYPTIYPTKDPNQTKPTSSPNTNRKTESKPTDNGLTGGAKAGIAFGVIAGVAVILVIAFFALKRYRPNSTVVRSFENVVYSK